MELAQKSFEDKTVTLKMQKAWQYMTEVQVGNPPQKLNIVFDTGSTNAYILGSKFFDEMKKDPKKMTEFNSLGKELGRGFNPKLSKTAKDQKETSFQMYGAGGLES